MMSPVARPLPTVMAMLRETIQRTWAALRAEGHADSEFVGVLRDRVGDDAVESDEREDEGERGEDSKEDGEETLLLEFGVWRSIHP